MSGQVLLWIALLGAPISYFVMCKFMVLYNNASATFLLTLIYTLSSGLVMIHHVAHQNYTEHTSSITGLVYTVI